MQSEVLKITLLGDHNVGKTCFLYSLVLNDFPAKYTPNAFPGDVNATTYTLKKQMFTLCFNDPLEGDDCLKLKPVSFPGTDLFAVFYDISRRESLQKISGLYERVCEQTPQVPVILVGNKIDLRQTDDQESSNEAMVTLQEACDVAETMNTICLECSALSGEGIHEAACVMVHMAAYGQIPKRRLFRKESKRQTIDVPLDSLILDAREFYGMDNAPSCPGVNVLPSKSVEDLAKMIHDTTCKDVRFIFEDNSYVDAHQIILISAAPTLFQEILTGTAKSQVSGLPQEMFEKISWPVHGGFQNDRKWRIVEIRVCKKVKRKEFLRLLEFLYEGASIAYLKSDDSIHELMAIAEKFQLQDLLTACENVLEGNELENIQKKTFVGGGKATILKDLFLKKPLLEDLVFQVQGNPVYAHQAVIVARCHVLAAMVTDYRTRNVECIRVKIEIADIIIETFDCLLEYLYTDDLPKDVSQDILLDILSLANRYELPRLVTLCEYRLILKVQEISDSRIAVSSVVHILCQAKIHEAHQLSKWCLNLIARNYLKFRTSKEMLRLSEQDREYVASRQWPQKCCLSSRHETLVQNYLDKRKRLFQSNATTRCAVM
ncbi:rho-related protein racA-like [Actinia tenebrosa]|uniref:Rho-related protein racA-like n=1 Tax=Actinia tenebrosa TaxID=6105 RepID=A0A6P8IRW9_ACTTE|nr:rho-related protein racA-like [Actinia tenebrosa]